MSEKQDSGNGCAGLILGALLVALFGWAMFTHDRVAGVERRIEALEGKK